MASSSTEVPPTTPAEPASNAEIPQKMEESGDGSCSTPSPDLVAGSSTGSASMGLLKGNEVIPPLSGSTIENDPVLAALRKYKTAAGSSFHPASEVAQEPPSFVRSSAADSQISIEDDSVTAMCGGACAADGSERPSFLTWFLGTALGLQMREVCCDAGSADQMVSSCESEEQVVDPERAAEAGPSTSGQGQLEMALGVFCSTHHELAARSQLVSTGVPGRYFINGFDVQLSLMDNAIVVIQGDHAPPVALLDYLNSPPVPWSAQAVGPLGVVQTPRTSSPPRMNTVKELPPGFSSATYDELDDDAKRAVACGDSLPDPAQAEALDLGEVVSPAPPEGSLACLRWARLSGPTGGAASLQVSAEVVVSELALVPPLDATQQRALHTALQQCSPVGSVEVAASLGVAKQRSPGGGVYAVWSAPAVLGLQPLVINAGTEVGAEASSSLLQWRVATARDVSRVLTQMHSSGICHGSLCPRCVLATSPSEMSSSGNVRVHIVEVGLIEALVEAKVLREHELLRLGPDYARFLAPEAAFDLPRSTGPSADVWALAQLLLFLFGCGAPHAECTTVQKLSSKVLPRRKQRPNIPDNAFPGMPELHDIILRCLSPDPSGRPQVWEVLEVLNACNPQEMSEVFTPAPGKASGSIPSPGKSSESNISFNDEAGTGAAPSPTFGGPGSSHDPDSPKLQSVSPKPASTGGSPTLESTGAAPVHVAPQQLQYAPLQGPLQPQQGVGGQMVVPQPGQSRQPGLAVPQAIQMPQGLQVVPNQLPQQQQIRGMTIVQQHK